MIDKEGAQEGLKKIISMPSILNEILELFKGYHINIPDRIILNVLILKIAQMVTSKWVKFDESGRINIPNWYALIFMASGTGKDQLVKDLDNTVFNNFYDWFETEARNIYLNQLKGCDSNNVASPNASESTNKIGDKTNGQNNPF